VWRRGKKCHRVTQEIRHEIIVRVQGDDVAEAERGEEDLISRGR